MPKRWFPKLDDRAWLEECYVTLGMTQQEIADDLGCHRGSVQQALVRHAIDRRGHGAPRRTRSDAIPSPGEAWLRDQYEAQRRSIEEIATCLGRSVMWVHRRMVEHGIPRRQPGLIRGGKQRADASIPRTDDGRSRRRYHSGYTRIHDPGHPDADNRGYVPEHRWVMEQQLGTHLPKGAVVHHIDGNPGNNDINNLALFLSQRAHRLHHHRCKEVPE